MSTDCLDQNETTTQHYFKPHKPSDFAVKAKKIPQSDEVLLSGYIRRNIQINGAPGYSKVWPKTMLSAEEYKDYLKRLECCKKELYNLFFRCSGGGDLSLLDKMISDLEKTVYQVDYSPDVYVLLRKCRLGKTGDELTNMKYYDTTYRTYFNRIEELILFKDVLFGLVRKENKEELRNELKKIYRMGTTTYNGTICVPAIELSKTKTLKNAPIDRYTLRRI